MRRKFNVGDVLCVTHRAPVAWERTSRFDFLTLDDLWLGDVVRVTRVLSRGAIIVVPSAMRAVHHPNHFERVSAQEA
jgi:hypothetical protein